MFNIYNNRKILSFHPSDVSCRSCGAGLLLRRGEDGRWSNIQNWRTSSGGSVQHNVVPSANDNIIIDENSFPGNVDELLVDLNLATCRDLQISTDIPFTLEVSAGNTLIISGSVEGRSTVDYEIRGQLNFNGSGTKTIDFGQEIRTHQLFIGAAGGDWTFVNDYYVEDMFQLTNGQMTFQDVQINAHKAIFQPTSGDRKSTRLNSSHVAISYAV